MKSERSQPTSEVATYRIAHYLFEGEHLILIPLDSSFGSLIQAEKDRISKAFQSYVAAARLKGALVLVWLHPSGKPAIVAPISVHELVKKKINFATLKANKELTIKGNVVCAQALAKNVPFLPAPDDRISLPGVGVSSNSGSSNPVGFLNVEADVERCQVIVDGNLVGESPTTVELSPGLHRIEVKKSGYRDHRVQVMISEGTSQSLSPLMERDETIMISLNDSTKLQAALDQQSKVAEFQQKHRGLVTLLFSDIVGSTKLKQELGDDHAVRLMQQHHRLVREILKTFPHGEEISTAGDSFFLVFDKPSDAVRFAILLQANLRNLSSQSNVQIRDRIGIHVGEVVFEIGGPGKAKDLYGIQVDTCARVMSLGEGDQILMTRFAYDNARQVLKGETLDGVGKLEWKSHGNYEFKGVDEPLEICEVGEVGKAVLRAPANAEKGSRATTPSSAAPQSQEHVILSTVTKVQPIKFFRSS